MKFRALHAIIVILYSGIVSAQDPHISQIYANRTFLNPAFTGMEEGLQVSTTARNQWYSADNGYNLVTVAAEWQEPCLNSGIGISFSYGSEGLAPLKSTIASLMYSYIIPLNRVNIHMGFKYSYLEKKLDWSRLTFSDELDPIFGDIYESVIISDNKKIQLHDVSFGVLARWDTKKKVRGNIVYTSRYHIGLSFNHLTSLLSEGPDESFFRTNNEIPGRITLHGGTIIPLEFLMGVGRKITISPNFRIESQVLQTGYYQLQTSVSGVPPSTVIIIIQ